MKISITGLRQASATKPDGYLDDCMKRGIVQGDYLDLSVSDYNTIRQKYSPGLGDVVAAIAKPIAQVIDGILGTNIQNCEGCAERQERLNSMFQNKPKE